MRQPVADKPVQFPLQLPMDTSFARDDFVAGAPNRNALAMIEGWPDWPSPFAVITGPPGSGKSHLAAIWQAQAHAIRIDRTAVAAPGDAAAAHLLEDADHAGLDETGLFHLMNAVRAAGGSLLITATRPPAQWPLATPDLMSRLKSATHADVAEPDDALLGAVMVKLFADRQLSVDQGVIAYLLRRMERSVPQAVRMVEALDAMSLSRKRPITRALAAEMLAQFDDTP